MKAEHIHFDWQHSIWSVEKLMGSIRVQIRFCLFSRRVNSIKMAERSTWSFYVHLRYETRRCLYVDDAPKSASILKLDGQEDLLFMVQGNFQIKSDLNASHAH